MLGRIELVDAVAKCWNFLFEVFKVTVLPTAQTFVTVIMGNSELRVRSEVSMAIGEVTTFLVLAPCRLVCSYRCFGKLSLKVETIYFSETSASVDESTWLENLEQLLSL